MIKTDRTGIEQASNLNLPSHPLLSSGFPASVRQFRCFTVRLVIFVTTFGSHCLFHLRISPSLVASHADGLD